MANPLSYPVQGVPVPVTVNEAYFALGRVLLPEPAYLPPTEAHKQTAYSGPPVKDQKGVKKSLGQGSRNEALFIHAARVYLSR